MELKPFVKNYSLTVVVEDGLDFMIENLTEEKAKQLYGKLIEKYDKDDIYPEVAECYSHVEKRCTSF